jgi:antitoxin (DNA-binding transcriptional repressor) of toxin-antitoxin stability system
MNTVNMLQAKSSLSRLVEAIELGKESEILIARNGRPVARLVPLNPRTNVRARLGVAKGKFEVPDSIDELNGAVAALFQGGQTD